MTDAPNRTGDTVKESADFRAACCGAFKKLTVDGLFPQCPKHGDAEWEKIPPIEAIQAAMDLRQPPPTVSGRTPHLEGTDPTAPGSASSPSSAPS